MVSLEWFGIGFPGEVVKMQERRYRSTSFYVITPSVSV